MKFTDRFISIPIKIFSVEQKELTGKEVCEDAIMKINPFEISRYHPSDETEDDEELAVTRIIFKDGNATVCYLPFNEFEKLLNNYAL